MSESDTHQHAPARMVAGQYRLLRELGHGGMGIVWLAEDEVIARKVAVKELRPPPGLTAAERGTFRRRALQEAKSAARIDHPNAVTFYTIIPATEDDDAVYLIMELIEGPTLAQLVQGRGRLPDAAVAGMGLQMLDVLDAAHALGVVHRDIKPGNILIAPGEQAKLTDFGIAHTIGDTRFTRSGIIGTQAYLAPELFEPGATITPAADLWALGATLYYAIEGRSAFERDNAGATLRAILLDDIPVPRCAAALAAAITGLLERDPAQRATTGQARDHLRQATARAVPAPAAPPLPAMVTPPAAWEQPSTTLAPSSPQVPSQAPTAAKPRTRQRRVLLITAASAAIVIAVAAGTSAAIATGSGPGRRGPSYRPGEITAALRAEKSGEIDSITFTFGGSTLATSDLTAGVDETWLWNPSTGKQIADVSAYSTIALPGNDFPFLAVISPDGKTMAVQGSSKIFMWDIAKQTVTRTINLPSLLTSASADPLVFSPDGRTLAVGAYTSPRVTLLNIASGAPSGSLAVADSQNSDEPDVITFSPDGKMLAFADRQSGDIYIWDVASRTLITRLTLPEEGNSCPTRGTNDYDSDIPGWIAFSRDGNTLAIADEEKGVLLWNLTTRQWGPTIPAPGVVGEQDVIAFSPDGKLLGTGNHLGGITLWNIASRQPVVTLTEPGKKQVTSMAFSPKGHTLATGDKGGHAYLWYVAGYG